MVTVGDDAGKGAGAWIRLAEALAQVRTRLPVTPDTNREMDIRRAIAEAGAAGVLSTVAVVMAEGRFQGRAIHQPEWSIPRGVWASIEVGLDAGWERGTLELPLLRQLGRSRVISQHPLTMIGVRVSAEDLSRLMGEWPEMAGGAVEADATSSPPERPRQKPGPTPNPHWAWAVAEVSREAEAAGFRKDLAMRGNKAAIVTMLLNKMTDKGHAMDPSTARKYVNEVKDKLPD